MTEPVLADLGAATREWFETTFTEPTPAQTGAWEAINRGANALVVAPTGSGKTLAAFLWAIDALAARPDRTPGTRVLYISPLKALAVDIDRNLRSPLQGIAAAATRRGEQPPTITTMIRTGDTPADERRRFLKHPADILITTPESLFLILTSQAREALVTVDTIIVDEVHAMAGTKRGTHLALSLERLDRMLEKPAQRIGLSATVRPPEEVAKWLGGRSDVEIIQTPNEKVFDLSVVVPVDDMAAIGGSATEPAEGSAAGAEARTSIWPHVEARVLDLVRAHRSTIIFANSRRLAERLCARLNELAEEPVARAHHGSVSREQRLLIEDDLKSGRLPAVVATSSLELGIDMGAVDLVIQVEAPDSVASGLQRIGRAGHQVGAVSRGVLFPKYRGDLLECAVVVERMRSGAIEEVHYPRNPLDVLAQHIVSMSAMEPWAVDDLEELVKGSAPYKDLPRAALESVLDMLSGRYPSEDFAELRARIDWDRTAGILSARRGAQHLAVVSGGTIPDRGLFGVYITGEKGARVGELDEEMVYESRAGEVFLLGASSWLIEDITPDRVIVSPAPGRPGKMPFWHGDAPGRPYELGRATGAFVREVMGAKDDARRTRLREAGLDELAASNLLAYLEEQRASTGVVPDDRTIVVERFRDELGDYRVCIHTHFGARLHAPWAQVIEARARESLGIEVQTMYSDDGIVVRVPDTDEPIDLDLLVIESDLVEELVVAEVGNSALFASRFRECAARSLLLPRRRPGSRTPLWLQRQKSSYLLQVARNYETFPVVLEAFRETLQDVFDLPGLVNLMAAIEQRKVRVVQVETEVPSPFASSLQFGYIGAFLYEGDAPLAERRAQALSLDRSLLAELMGRDELRELIDPEALASLELELQLLVGNRRIRDVEDLQDALRSLGDLSAAEVAARCVDPSGASGLLEELSGAGRAISLRVAGDHRWIAVEDAARYRDALGCSLPMGLPSALLESAPDPVTDLVGRFARTHGPFTATEPATRFGLGPGVVLTSLKALGARGRALEGEFRPSGSGREWVDVDVLRRLRRRSLAAWRKEIEAVAPEEFARFQLAWQGVGPQGSRSATPEALYRVIESLQGAAIPASALESQVLPARLAGYRLGMLDELGAAGEIVWAGAGPIGSDDGWVVLATQEHAAYLLPHPVQDELSEEALAIVEALGGRGALFFRQIADAIGSTDDKALLLSLWESVWSGHVTNDTLTPMRALTGHHRSGSSPRPPRPRRGPQLPARTGPPSAAGRWSLVPEREESPTRRLHALSEQLLDRYGIVTRGAVAAEKVGGGWAAIYGVLAAAEEAGRARRGYFIEGLGGSQFALPGAVDRLRAAAREEAHTQVLAATDPANPYGAALEWPARSEGGHRPGRKAGALVVIVDGSLILYVERGGRTVLSFSDESDALSRAADAIALAVHDGMLGRLNVEQADGEAITDTPLGAALLAAGFRHTSRGLRPRA